MNANKRFAWLIFGMGGLLCSGTTLALPFSFSTGNPDGKMATASRPDTGVFEIESADDFVLSSRTVLNSATFQGILTNGATLGDIGRVVVEIYRVFPNDSTSPPSGHVPTRMNSPSDVAFDSRDSVAGTLSLVATLESPSFIFTALNSVQPGGIHSSPNQTTLGDGPAIGAQVLFNVTFSTPFNLPADHYFFVPQVQVTGGDFLWLSAPKPIVAPGTPFPPGSTDLQSWTRDAGLDPDWLRIGTDIVGGSPAPTFNAVFSLTGETVPEPATLALLALAFAGMALAASGERRTVAWGVSLASRAGFATHVILPSEHLEINRSLYPQGLNDCTRELKVRDERDAGIHGSTAD
jgi:hypothetical protein